MEIFENKTPMNQLLEFLITTPELTLNKILKKAEELSRTEYRMICDAYYAAYENTDGCALHYYQRTFTRDVYNPEDFITKVPGGDVQLTMVFD